MFTSPPPPHAFPASYPPTCAYDPFPCTSGPLSFERPEWRRLPCSRLLLPVSISINDLVWKFSQLNVRGETRIKGSARLESHAATAAITVIPSRAPHPSLIVHKRPNYPCVVLTHSSTRAPTLRLHAFEGFGPTSKPITLIPLSAPSHEPSPMRKTAPLPQRLAARKQDTERDSTPSEYSSSRVFSAGSKSRSCSLSSVSSSTS